MLIQVWCSVLLIVIFLIFVIGRFICKRCDATVSERDEAFKPDNRIRYQCGTALITLITLTAVSGLVFGGWGYNQMANDAGDQMLTQAQDLSFNVEMIYKNAERYNELLFPDDYKKKFG